jgi:hypothetical protein
VASAGDISTGDIHVFELTTMEGEIHTLRARAVHCHGPRGEEAAYLSGWRCATDDTTTIGLRCILAYLTGGSAQAGPAPAQAMRKAAAVWQVVITTVTAGNVAGHAVICPEIRYAAVRWQIAHQIDRRLGSSAMWVAIKGELTDRESGTKLSADSITSALLVPEGLRSSCALEVQDRPVIRAASRDALTEALDKHLWHIDDVESVRMLVRNRRS